MPSGLHLSRLHHRSMTAQRSAHPGPMHTGVRPVVLLALGVQVCGNFAQRVAGSTPSAGAARLLSYEVLFPNQAAVGAALDRRRAVGIPATEETYGRAMFDPSHNRVLLRHTGASPASHRQAHLCCQPITRYAPGRTVADQGGTPARPDDGPEGTHGGTRSVYP